METSKKSKIMVALLATGVLAGFFTITAVALADHSPSVYYNPANATLTVHNRLLPDNSKYKVTVKDVNGNKCEQVVQSSRQFTSVYDCSMLQPGEVDIDITKL